MNAGYDVIIIGVGGMGSAAAWRLARRGKKVLGLERFAIGHAMGSSHGVNRIIRRPYFEHHDYVPLVARAYELWRELEAASGERLLVITGGVDAGPRDSANVVNAISACEKFDLPHEVLDASAVSEKFPGIRLAPGHKAVFQRDGGFVMSEAAIAAHVRLARAAGATIQDNERVLDWSASGARVRVRTDRGVYEADQLVIAAGAWMPEIVPALREVTAPERQVLCWFEPLTPEIFDVGRFPVFTMLTEDEGEFYGFPQFGVPGFKIGRHRHLRQQVEAETVDREPRDSDEAVLRRAVERYFPQAAGKTVRRSVCLYTNTPDEDFIIDRHPDHSEVLLLSPCSGHGYKFCPVVGEIAADLVIEGRTRHDIGFLSLARFAGRSHAR